jgi:hypothetical protein
MPKINFIPERYEEGFKKISSIDEELFKDINDGLSSSPLMASLGELSETVAKLKEINENDVSEIFYSAGSLTPFIETEENLDEMSEDVSTIAIEEQIIDERNKKRFKTRLTSLLRNKQLFYASKVNGLLTEYGNVFLQSRIVTDIRPVFGINPNDVPEAGIIIHNLHIHYQDDSEGAHKDFYIALDTNDIKNLKAALIRAEAKEKSLQLLYDKTGLINLTK